MLVIAFTVMYALNLLLMCAPITAERKRFRKKAGRLGQSLTQDGPVLDTIDLLNLRRKPVRERGIKICCFFIIRGSVFNFYERFRFSGRRFYSTDVEVEDEENTIDYLEPLLSGSTDIPDAISDEKYLLNPIFVKEDVEHC